MVLEPKTDKPSIYDVKLSTWDGQEDMLSNYKGKVTMFINVTGHCGNAPQYGLIEDLYQKYKDQGFEVVAVPTNDFCGPGVTYGEYEDGIKDAEAAVSYGSKEYGVSYKFSELVKSNMNEEWQIKKNRVGDDVHPLYELIASVSVPTGGNFEKYLFDRNGHYLKHFPNGYLLDFANEHLLEMEEGQRDPSDLGWIRPASDSYAEVCSVIEEALAL